MLTLPRDRKHRNLRDFPLLSITYTLSTFSTPKTSYLHVLYNFLLEAARDRHFLSFTPHPVSPHAILCQAHFLITHTLKTNSNLAVSGGL